MNRISLLLSMSLILGVVAYIALPGPADAQLATRTELPEVEATEHVTVLPGQLEWNPVASLPAGATAAMIEGDLSEPVPFTFRLRFPANYEIPAHTHPTTERVTVLEGTLHLAAGDDLTRDATEAFVPGSVTVMPPRMEMYGYTGSEPVIIQLNGIGPWGIDYLNPEDDPRN